MDLSHCFEKCERGQRFWTFKYILTGFSAFPADADLTHGHSSYITFCELTKTFSFIITGQSGELAVEPFL